LSDALGNTIDQVRYLDSDPWPQQADGEGPYLRLVDVNSDNSLASNWIASSQSLSTADVTIAKRQIFVYPNPTKGIITVDINFLNTDSLEFSMYNSLGQSVGDFQLKSNNLQLNIDFLKSGFYYYNIKYKAVVISRGKIVKK
jgi:hypothetical protein